MLMTATAAAAAASMVVVAAKKSNVLGATTNQFTIILISFPMDLIELDTLLSIIYIIHFIGITMIIYALSLSRFYLYKSF